MALVNFASGNAADPSAVGMVKALDNGVIVLGNDQDDVIDWFECPNHVAGPVRDATVSALMDCQAGYPVPPINWRAVIGAADAEFAAQFFDGVTTPRRALAQ